MTLPWQAKFDRYVFLKICIIPIKMIVFYVKLLNYYIALNSGEIFMRTLVIRSLTQLFLIEIKDYSWFNSSCC